MLKSTAQLIEKHLDEHVIRDIDLAQLLKGSDARRYGLVNKALKKGELIRICRGFYIIGKKYQKQPVSQFYLANRVVPHSFVTAESALSYHGLIPERITQITSIAAFGRSREFKTPYGVFTYKLVPVAHEHFYYGVNLIEINKHMIYMASPLRALIDYLYWHKIKNANVNFLKKSLRIEADNLQTITKQDIAQLDAVYQVNYIHEFLENLTQEIIHE